MNTILVPLDGSALAEQVLPYVRLLAKLLDAKAHLLRVIPEEQGQHLLAELNTKSYPAADALATQLQREQRVWEMLIQGAQNYLAELASSLRESGLQVEVDVRPGDPAEQIVAVVANKQTTLVAMATHGYSGLRRWRLGSVTDKVVHAAATPVFVVRGAAAGASADPQLKHLLVPLDGSELARQALPIATELARAAAADLTLLEVIDEVSAADRLAPDRWGTAQRELAELAAQLGEQVAAAPVVERGYPAEVIVDKARALQTDLIVMATHGYSGLRRWTLGSVADKVLHASSLPLLLVRAQAGAAEDREIAGK